MYKYCSLKFKNIYFGVVWYYFIFFFTPIQIVSQPLINWFSSTINKICWLFQLITWDNQKVNELVSFTEFLVIQMYLHDFQSVVVELITYVINNYIKYLLRTYIWH